MTDILDLLNNIADLVEKAKNTINQKNEKPKNNDISFAEIRQKLADLSRQGYTSIIKEELNKKNVEKLSDVNPDEYKDLLDAIKGAIDGKQE